MNPNALKTALLEAQHDAAVAEAQLVKVEKMFLKVSERYATLLAYVKTLGGTNVPAAETPGSHGGEPSTLSREYHKRGEALRKNLQFHVKAEHKGPGDEKGTEAVADNGSPTPSE